MTSRIGASIVAGAMLIGLAVTSQASTVSVETVSVWNGTQEVFSFGEPNTATYGQTFRTPDAIHTVLDDFTFYLRQDQPGVPVQFGAYVYAWDSLNSRATGPNLFQSAMFETTNNGGAGGFEAITAVTGGISLDSGVDYVAFFSASEYFDGAAGLATFGATPLASYSDGRFVFINNGSNTGQWTGGAWTTTHQGGINLAFDMTFSDGLSVVPLPPAAAMGFLMMGLLGAIRHRRRKH